MPTTIKYDTEEAWLDLRAENITSTESAALFGMSPYCTEYELWHRKSGGFAVEFEENERMKWGKRSERMIAEGFGEDMDMAVRPLKDYYRHSEESRMGCSLDYGLTTADGDKGLLEIKNVDYLVYRDQWTEDEAPEHIEMQVQHQMEVMDVEWCYIVALVGGNQLHSIRRERNREMGQGIRLAIRTFWQFIDDGIEPAPDFDADADFIIAMHQKCGGEYMRDDGLERAFRMYLDAQAAEVVAKDNKKAIKAAILDEVGDEYAKVEAGSCRLSCGLTKGSAGTLITPEMVGTRIGGRKGFRNFRINEIGKKKGDTL